MRFAEKDGERLLPNPLEKNAICPLCKSGVVGKCGKIKIWHWAHKDNKDCDNWGGRETEWHLNWKNEFPQDSQEVIIGNHRADVKIKDIVIEFQNTSISLDDIKNRENYYGKMKWILNSAVFAQNLQMRDKNGFKSFRWKWPPKTWLNAISPIYIDMQPLVDEWIKFTELPDEEIISSGGGFIKKLNRVKRKQFLIKEIPKYSNKMFLIKKVYNSLPCGGWGKLISKEEFIQEVKDGYYGY